jgi:hypothetical protein
VRSIGLFGMEDLPVCINLGILVGFAASTLSSDARLVDMLPEGLSVVGWPLLNSMR